MSANIAAIRAALSQANADTPRRGGRDFLGRYVGGAALRPDYTLDSSVVAYQCALQLRTEKSLLSIEAGIRSMVDDASALRFNGKLEIRKTDTVVDELDKERLLLKVDDLVRTYGFQTFFYLPDQHGAMKYLPDHPHFFTVQDVIDVHVLRMTEPPMVTTTLADGTVEETEASVLDRFVSYDKFEKFDIAISRRVIQALIASPIQDKIRIKFSHDPLFRTYPGSVYLMMALDVCNTSSSLEISLATQEFQALSLDNYGGQNIDDFATEAQRLIKIMSMGYALPYKTGSTLLSKVDATESNYFNQKVHGWQSIVKEMERSVGPNQNPKQLEKHPSYAKYSPLRLCALLQTEYGLLLESEEWPAASSTRPEGNVGADNGILNPNGRKCYRCGSRYHLANDSTCPEARDTPAEENSNPTPPAMNGNSTNTSNPPGSNAWKYIKPADEDQKVTMNGMDFFFCGKCRCRRTGKVGFYNRTHSTSQHRAGQGNGGRNNSSNEAPAATSESGGDEANLSPVEDATPPPDDSSSKQSHSDNLAADEEVDADPNGLKFVGAYLSDIVEDNEVWVAGVQDASSVEDMTYGATLVSAPGNSVTSVNNSSKAKATSFYSCLSTHPSSFQESDNCDSFFDCMILRP